MKSIKGDILFRAGSDEPLYILEEKHDLAGSLWYRVNICHNKKNVCGWVMAEYVLAGDELFHNITQISAGNCGFIALRSDGTVAGAGVELPYLKGLKKALDGLENITAVSCENYTYTTLKSDGTCFGKGKDDTLLKSFPTASYLSAKSEFPFIISGDRSSFDVYLKNVPLYTIPENTLPDNTRVLQAAGNDTQMLLLTQDGTLHFLSIWALQDDMQSVFQDWNNITDTDMNLWTNQYEDFFILWGSGRTAALSVIPNPSIRLSTHGRM